ncbi:RNA polymerase sigma factor [Actinomadura rudentiformis]|uniref:RNA polymerase sigma factor n=1 Tax=Actinomadura rudentiformis TaxID=359158 RepID=UPI001CEF6D17|nr:sigma-70 family RNA polymerase sigma factor [Actinomadura rudentiformis]
MDDPESRFTRLYDQNYRRVLAYALTHAEPHTAEDIASETFLIAWRRLGDIGEPPLPWLLGVARNLLHKQRSHGHRRRVLAERIAELTGPADVAAWDVAEHVVERETALAAVAGLSERDLEVLSLVNWHGLDPRQAAKVVGCSSAAFFVRLHRARKRLAKALENGPEAGPAAVQRPVSAPVAKEAAR